MCIRDSRYDAKFWEELLGKSGPLRSEDDLIRDLFG